MLSQMTAASGLLPRKLDEYWPDAFNTKVTWIVKYRETSFFSLAAKRYMHVLLLAKKNYSFIWIFLLLDTETTSVSSFYNIESYFYFIKM